jgi:hypothetical protein
MGPLSTSFTTSNPRINWKRFSFVAGGLHVSNGNVPIYIQHNALWPNNYNTLTKVLYIYTHSIQLATVNLKFKSCTRQHTFGFDSYAHMLRPQRKALIIFKLNLMQAKLTTAEFFPTVSNNTSFSTLVTYTYRNKMRTRCLYNHQQMLYKSPYLLIFKCAMHTAPTWNPWNTKCVIKAGRSGVGRIFENISFSY